MVSKASDDLPEPLGPVITTSRSRGSVRLMFFRLCCRAPRTTSRFMGRRELARTGRGWAPHSAARAVDGPLADARGAVPWRPRLSLPAAPGGLERSGHVRAKIWSMLKAVGGGAAIGAAGLSLLSLHNPSGPS